MNKELPSLRVGNLESESPIFLGGMSVGLTTAELAAEVANKGGFGTIGGVGLGISPEVEDAGDFFEANEAALKREIQNALEISNDGNIGVNLMVATTDYEDSVRVAVENRAKFIASGAGLPLRLPEYVEKYKVFGQKTPELIPIVSSVRVAKIILKRWTRQGVLPSAFIVETPNTAGGHLGVTDADDIGKDEFSLEHVVPELNEYLKSEEYADLLKGFNGEKHDIPIIAAGGIWDRADVERMLKLGAKGAQLATRFLTTDECNASQEFKDRHLNNTDPIVVIKSPVGMPGRAIENDFVRRTNSGEKIDLGPCVGCLNGCKGKLAGYCIVRALDNVRRGDVENGVLFTGSNGYRLKEDREKGIFSAGQIMQELTKTET
jgi:nitronate monooxygenase